VLTEIIRVKAQPPESLTRCPEAPPAPADDADEPTFWDWTAARIAAGDECREVVKERARFDAAVP
jgi:hypothetical protein